MLESHRHNFGVVVVCVEHVLLLRQERKVDTSNVGDTSAVRYATSPRFATHHVVGILPGVGEEIVSLRLLPLLVLLLQLLQMLELPAAFGALQLLLVQARVKEPLNRVITSQSLMG